MADQYDEAGAASEETTEADANGQHFDAPEHQAAPVDQEEPGAREGMPLWMPLVGMLLAFVAAIFVGARICPVLSAIVMPPDPRLPAGAVKPLTHEQKGNGLDEWTFGTPLTGCEVALFYQDWLKDCSYDPDEVCLPSGKEVRKVAPAGQGYHITTCAGKQSIGAYSVLWTAYVSSGYAGENLTIFRLVREVSN